MAIGTNKDKPQATDSLTLEELKKKRGECVEAIRNVLNKYKDKRDISIEDKRVLRQEYSKAANYSKSISSRTMNDEEKAKFEEEYKKLLAKAAEYGSVMSSSIPKTTFDDVKGLKEVKKVVESFAFMADNPELVEHYKMQGGLGILMYGAPGTGKTMFAEALANKMQLPLFIVTPADIFKSYVGESEQAVKQLFQEIDASPEGAVLFVDECESIFSKRNADTKDYKAAVTTELLQRINGFGVNGSKRIMVAATNRPDVIDPAYLRYKRFSHLVHVTPPDEEAIEAIITAKLPKIVVNGQKVPHLEEGLTIQDLVAKTQETEAVKTSLGVVERKKGYYSGADISGIVEEACRLALETIQEKNLGKAIPLTKEMFDIAFSKIPPSISPELLAEYENFRGNINNKGK